jgi:hypothetical protein
LGTLYYGQQQLPVTLTNHFLAHLQAAAYKRFSLGAGFFLTTTAQDPDGKEVSAAHWLSPAIPLVFSYDVRDDADDHIGPVTLDYEKIDSILDAMDRPGGVRDTSAVWVAFMERP